MVLDGDLLAWVEARCIHTGDDDDGLISRNRLQDAFVWEVGASHRHLECLRQDGLLGAGLACFRELLVQEGLDFFGVPQDLTAFSGDPVHSLGPAVFSNPLAGQSGAERDLGLGKGEGHGVGFGCMSSMADLAQVTQMVGPKSGGFSV